MRVLVLHNRYRQPGGEDVAALREIAMLREHGVEVAEHFVDNDGSNFKLLAGSGWSGDSYRTTLKLCRKFRPDIVHVHNFWMRLTPSVHAAAHAAGAATVQTLHNYRLICANGMLLRNGKVCEDCVGHWAWRGVLRRCYHDSATASAAAVNVMRSAVWQRDVDAFITPSESARSRLLRAAIPGERLFVKPNFIADPGIPLQPPSASKRIVFAGRLTPEKGLPALLAAWDKLRRRVREGAELVIAGDGPERPAVSAADVIFRGRLSNSEWLNEIRSARAVVVPSICLETFGSTVVEAFACGRPALVSGLGALGELVQDGWNGLHFDAAALERVLADDELADRLGANARTDWEAHYTADTNFQQLDKIYTFAMAQQSRLPMLRSLRFFARRDDLRSGAGLHPASRFLTGFCSQAEPLQPGKAGCKPASRLETCPTFHDDSLRHSRTVLREPERVPAVQMNCEQGSVLLGTQLSRANYGEVLRICRDWTERRESKYVVVLTVHSIMTAFFDRDFRAILNSAGLGVTDGMPLVWALRSFGVKQKRRVYGPDLMQALCGQAQRLGHRIFLYGGHPDSLPVLCARLQRRFPGLQIAGSYSPPFRPLTPDEDAAAIQQIRDSRADIVFCGIGLPKQERWMASHIGQLPGCILLGVGAAFDFHAGRVRQAPHWMQGAGLEWLFRLTVEPARLWKRYVFPNPLFLLLWALQLITGPSLPKRIKG